MAFPPVVPVSIVPDISSAAPDPIAVDPYIIGAGGYTLIIGNVRGLLVYIAGRAARSRQGGGYCNDK
jgi:hypothetical protein